MRKPLTLAGLMLAFLFSTPALASWGPKQQVSGYSGMSDDASWCSARQATVTASANGIAKGEPYRFTSDSSCKSSYNSIYRQYEVSSWAYIQVWQGSMEELRYTSGTQNAFENGDLKNFQPDDEMCKAVGTVSASMASADGETATFSGCTFTSNGLSACTDDGMCSADWEPIGAADTASSSSSDNLSSPPEKTTPDYLTETDNPASCPSGSYGTGGKSYCVDQSAIDTGRINGYAPPPSSGGGDSSSGSGSTGGGTGSGGSTGGGSSGGGSGGGVVVGGGGNGSGTDLSGVISAINSVRDSIRSGFDGLADSITDGMQDKLTEEGENPDDLVEEAGIDGAFDEMEQSAGSVNGRLENLVKGNEIGSGADSGLTDQLKGYLPSFGGSGGCTPLQFFPGEIYAFTVDCVVFDKAKLYLSWLLYVWTVYTILDIFFATAPRRA